MVSTFATHLPESDPAPTQANPADRPAWHTAIAEPAIEFGPVVLPVLAGALPPGLAGTLYRNGAGRLVRGGVQAGHWFDGDGTILAVRFAGSGSAQATYRYVQTQGLQAEEAADRPLFHNYGTIAPGPWLSRFGRELKNVANTSVLVAGDRLLALWEAGHPHGLDPQSLDTIGKDDLDGTLNPAETFSAHPKVDPVSGEIYNFSVAIGPIVRLVLFRCDQSGRIQQRRSIPLPRFSFVHDCVLAGPYWVFCLPPIRLDLWPALLNLQTFSDSLQWRPQLGTRLIVIDRQTLEPVSQIEADPWFQWHFGNGWQEADGSIAFTVVRYPDFATNQHLKEVVSGHMVTTAQGQFCRVRLNPQAGRVLDVVPWVDRHCEFPTVAAADVGQPTRYTYLAIHRPGFDDPEATKREQFGAIARHDATTGAIAYGVPGPGRYVSEPLFVPDPDRPGQASAGWVLTVVYDSPSDRSEVWLYDGDRLEAGPVCRLGLPERVNLTFHGTWHGASDRPG